MTYILVLLLHYRYLSKSISLDHHNKFIILNAQYTYILCDLLANIEIPIYAKRLDYNIYFIYNLYTERSTYHYVK